MHEFRPMKSCSDDDAQQQVQAERERERDRAIYMHACIVIVCVYMLLHAGFAAAVSCMHALQQLITHCSFNGTMHACMLVPFTHRQEEYILHDPFFK